MLVLGKFGFLSKRKNIAEHILRETLSLFDIISRDAPICKFTSDNRYSRQTTCAHGAAVVTQGGRGGVNSSTQDPDRWRQQTSAQSINPLSMSISLCLLCAGYYYCYSVTALAQWP